MKEYYLHDGENQQGPFSSNDLKERQITRETYVWKEGMTDWVKAGNLPELNGLFAGTPPSFKPAVTVLPPEKAPVTSKPSVSKTERAGTWIGRNPRIFWTIFILLIAAAFILYKSQPDDNTSSGLFESSPSSTEKTPEELRTELKQKEKDSPTEYLNPDITMRTNLIGEKVFEGSISNNSSAATFKDAVVEITYLSKTGSALGTKEFTVYEIFGPQQNKPIKKLKTNAPRETDGFSVRVISGTAIE